MLAERIKGLLFPRFSESDAFALLLAILMPGIEFRDNVWESLKNFELSDFDPRILITATVFIYLVYVIVKNALSNKEIPIGEKKNMAVFFYSTLGASVLKNISGFFSHRLISR